MAKRRFVDFLEKVWTFFIYAGGCGIGEKRFDNSLSSEMIIKRNNLNFGPVHSMFQL